MSASLLSRGELMFAILHAVYEESVCMHVFSMQPLHTTLVYVHNYSTMYSL